MRPRPGTFSIVLALHLCPADTSAQQITRDNYYVMLPPTPRIVGQTQASATIRLFGDRTAPAFRDVDPADGIDDARGARLMQLAERFSPIIRPNNLSVPRDPYDVIGQLVVLHVDRWENAERVASDSLVLSSGQLVAQAGAPNDVAPRPAPPALRTAPPFLFAISTAATAPAPATHPLLRPSSTPPRSSSSTSPAVSRAAGSGTPAH